MGNKNFKKKDARISVKKKRWYNVLAPKVLNNVIVGETPSADPKLLEGRVVTINLSTVTRNMKKQNVGVKFRVVEVKGNDCVTNFVGYELLPAQVKRLVKRSKCRVDDSFVVESKDKKMVRLKPLVLTRDKTHNGVLSALRKGAKEFLTKKLSDMEYNEFVNKLLMGEIQRELKTDLKKLYPLGVAEIRAVKLVK